MWKLFTLIFSVGSSVKSNRQVDKNISEMRKQGRGIRVLDKDGNIKFIPMG